MGAIARQVLQVKRKNSTNWSPPEARLTVAGSVAWRSGPREVATGSAVGAEASVGASTAGWVAGSRVAAASVALGSIGGWVAAGVGFAELVAGAQEASKTASKIRLVLSVVEGVGKRRVFIIISL
jgi:hypothetical protein